MINYYRKNFLRIEAAIAVTFTVFLIAIFHNSNHIDQSMRELVLQKMVVFPTILTTATSLLGIIIAAFVFLFSIVDRPHYWILRESASYGTQWAVFKHAIYALALCSVVSLTTMIVGDHFGHLNDLIIITIGSITLVFLRMWRVIWVLQSLSDAEVSHAARAREIRTRK